MLGPILLLVGFTTAGAVTDGWAGAVVGAALALAVTGAVMVAAASWATRVGRLLDQEDAWELAPRPPLFRRVCDLVYRRLLPEGDRGSDDQTTP